MARSALVTGGSSGIGLAIATALRADGFDVTVAARTAGKLEAAAAEIGAHAVPANVTDEDDLKRLLAAHVERFGGLDVLVNSAGTGIGGPFESFETRHLDRQLAINLRGLSLLVREAIPHLRATRGLVVNLASIAGTAPAPGLALYGATKAAVISLTHSLNAELGDDGIRVTAVCPGYVATPMAEWTGIPPEQMIQPEDCAEVVRMLLALSPAARVPVVVIDRTRSVGSAVDL